MYLGFSKEKKRRMIFCETMYILKRREAVKTKFVFVQLYFRMFRCLLFEVFTYRISNEEVISFENCEKKKKISIFSENYSSNSVTDYKSSV